MHSRTGPFLAAVLGFGLVTAPHSVRAALRLGTPFGDGAVVQQGGPLPVWGWAAPGAKVTARFAGQVRKAAAGPTGRWQVVFDMTAGGNGDLVVTAGRETVTARDLVSGEVWVCSGQSNMGMSVSGSEGGKEAAKAGADPYLRFLKMPDVASDRPLAEVPAHWKAATPDTVGGFSAAGYWFARQLRQELSVPVGMIQAAWGGTCAETWTDAKSLADDPALKPILAGWKERVRKNPDAGLGKLDFRLEIDRIDLVPADGSGNVPLDRFTGTALPGKWGDGWTPGISEAKFEVTAKGAKRGIFSGTVRMASWAGVTRSLGETDQGADLSRFSALRVKVRGRGHFRFAFRQPGVWDWAFHETPAFRATEAWQELTFSLTSTAQPDWGYQKPIDLKAVSGLILTTFLSTGPYPEMPSCLYNGELAPVIPYPLRGAIWYQGEGNAGRAWQYRSLLPAMIRGWRKAWGAGDFPFIMVQLPGWREPSEVPADSDWAELREAQAVAAEAVPNCDYVCAIDLGDAANIHPPRKREIGERLALAAFVRAYGRNAEHSGPRYAGMTVEDGKIRLRFSHMGPGLAAVKDGNISGFGIAGEDRKFVKARAVIEGDTVLVSSREVPSPVAVRYAWANNPACNLRGLIGLPVPPFRTDDWPLTTLDNR